MYPMIATEALARMKGARRRSFSDRTAVITVRHVAMAYGGTVRSWAWAAV
jgi:hypothetical protein